MNQTLSDSSASPQVLPQVQSGLLLTQSKASKSGTLKSAEQELTAAYRRTTLTRFSSTGSRCMTLSCSHSLMRVPVRCKMFSRNPLRMIDPVDLSYKEPVMREGNNIALRLEDLKRLTFCEGFGCFLQRF